MPFVLTTHEEKVNFLKKFLQNETPSYSRETLLMLVGSGGNGKTLVLQEVLEATPVNVCVVCENRFRFYPAKTGSSDSCAYILVCNGAPDDFDVAEYFNANVVEFLKDPNYPLAVPEKI